MSRSKRDILDTERMLERLTECLAKHRTRGKFMQIEAGESRADAEALRRISMTLHTWHEHECNGNIARGKRDKGRAFEWDEAGAPYWVSSQDNTPRWRMPDREAGAMKRLNKIMARYPALSYYVQGDPRGCALYILKPGDVPKPVYKNVAAYYSRGLAVFK